MKQLTLFLIALASFSGAALPAQDISGIWVGKLVPGRNIGSLYGSRILLTISKAENGGWKAVLSNTGQALENGDLPVTSITFENRSLKFAIAALHGQYEGDLKPDGAIAGHWTQGDGWRQFDLRRTLVTVHVTGEQLEQTLSAARVKPDKKVAEQLSGLELTERMSAARLARCVADLPGPLAKQAFTVLIDKSAFLDLPAGEIPSLQKPEVEAQQQMISLTVDYVHKTIHQLPNLFATRNTVSFEEDLWMDRPLHSTGKFSAIVLYRDGDEKINPARSRSSEERGHPNLFQSGAPGLTTSGEFGPILGTAIIDADQGDLVWSHWEEGAAGPEAVFRYAVTAKNSHYKVDQELSGYRGEIAIDPATGAILRLVLRSDPQPGDPLLRADILVEYGPVELGGKTYICPVRGVALSRVYIQEWLNDVVFDQYHLYRAESRILPGYNANP
jgi:hypothetical protein